VIGLVILRPALALFAWFVYLLWSKGQKRMAVLSNEVEHVAIVEAIRDILFFTIYWTDWTLKSIFPLR
jgi:hypothetical protein